MHGGVRRQGGEELRDGAGVSGQQELRPEVGEGLEDEAAAGEARVGHGQTGGVLHEMAGVENVEVERTRGVVRAAGGAAVLAFECGEVVEEEGGVEGGFDFDHGIEEGGRIGRAVDGDGFVEGGDEGRRGSFVQGEEGCTCGAQWREAFAEVGAEGNAGSHGRSVGQRGRGGNCGGRREERALAGLPGGDWRVKGVGSEGVL